MFSLKSRNPYPSCNIYEGTCSCGSVYVGETKRNCAVRWSEHDNPTGSSEPSKHLYNHPSHYFSWRILMSAPENTRMRKSLESSIIALTKPDLNNQVDSKKLTLFRYGVTQVFRVNYSNCGLTAFSLCLYFVPRFTQSKLYFLCLLQH